MSNRKYYRYITITDNVPENWDKIIKVAQSCYKFYWYVFHDKDEDDNGLKKKHIHIVCYDSSPCTIDKAIKNFNGCTLPNLVDGVDNGRAMIRYLIHKDDPHKYQYDAKDVITNNIKQFLSAIDDNDSITAIFDDYELVRTGRISVGEFIQKYKQHLSQMNFYQQLQTFKLLSTIRYKD